MVWLTADDAGAGAAGGNAMFVSNAGTGKNMVFFRASAGQNTLKQALSELVSAGTISQTPSDAVLAYVQANTPQNAAIKVAPPAGGAAQGPVIKIVDPLRDLVNNGTLTTAQAHAVRDKERAIAEQQMQQWQTVLNPLVSNGAITRDQASKILAFPAASNQKMQVLLDQGGSMSPKDMAQYMEQNMSAIKNPVSQMVDQGLSRRLTP